MLSLQAMGDYCDASIQEKCWLFPASVIAERLSRKHRVTDNKCVDVDRLRAETRPEHEATEATVPLMAAGLTRAVYSDTLRRMYAVVRGWEIWAAAHAPAPYRELLARRQRAQLAEADLAFFEQPLLGKQHVDVPALLTAELLEGDDARPLSPARFLGAMYVVEGSTLGGQYIAKHVEERFGLREGKGNSYFRGYGEHTGSMWRSFKEEMAALPDSDTEEAIAAARTMFGVFAKAMS